MNYWILLCMISESLSDFNQLGIIVFKKNDLNELLFDQCSVVGRKEQKKQQNMVRCSI